MQIASVFAYDAFRDFKVQQRRGSTKRQTLTFGDPRG